LPFAEAAVNEATDLISGMIRDYPPERYEQYASLSALLPVLGRASGRTWNVKQEVLGDISRFFAMRPVSA